MNALNFNLRTPQRLAEDMIQQRQIRQQGMQHADQQEMRNALKMKIAQDLNERNALKSQMEQELYRAELEKAAQAEKLRRQAYGMISPGSPAINEGLPEEHQLNYGSQFVDPSRVRDARTLLAQSGYTKESQELGDIYADPTKDGLTTEQRTFQYFTDGMTEKEREKARRIALGLDPRAVGSSGITIATTPGLTGTVAGSESTIAEQKKFAEMQGSQRSQYIDKSFDKVQKLEQNLANLDNAIDAVKQGAGVGAIEKRFPSLRNTSVLLDQVQGALALDVIGSVTFGALSEGELNLAKAIAIPTGLDGPELIEWLTKKKEAQTKLLNYFKEQIDHLDQGGSVASFMRKKERDLRSKKTPTSTTNESTGTDLSGVGNEQLLNLLNGP